jgi:hypothetical protein
MASLLPLMNRAVSYFKSGTNSEVSTDDETNNVDCGSSDDGMSTDDNEIIPYEDTPKYLCTMCEYSVPITCQRGSAWQCCMGGVAFLWERLNFGPRQNKNHPTDQDQIWQA